MRAGSGGSFTDWRKRYGKVNEHNGPGAAGSLDRGLGAPAHHRLLRLPSSGRVSATDVHDAGRRRGGLEPIDDVPCVVEGGSSGPLERKAVEEGNGLRSAAATCAFYLFIRAHRTGLVSSLPASCLHDFVVCFALSSQPSRLGPELALGKVALRASGDSGFSPTSAGSRFRLPSRFQTRRGPGAPVLSSFVFLDTTRRATGRRRPLRADVWQRRENRTTHNPT